MRQAPGRHASISGPVGRSILLVGLMGAGKTSIGRRLATRLGMPFRDADAEIELAAGCTIAEYFARFGEPAFRAGERRVMQRLLSGPPIVLATGGGAFMDAQTRATARARAISVWLRCPLPVLIRRVAGRSHRPLLANNDVATTLAGLARVRHPVYAEADIIVDCGEETPDVTTSQVLEAITEWRAPRRLPVALSRATYDVVVGPGLLERAGALLAPVLPQKRVVIITDATVAGLHLARLQAGLDETGFQHDTLVVPPGESSKSLASYTDLVERVLALGVERRTSIVALGGGVVGDLAGFTAASVLRGLPFVQLPTTLLSQVDSSVGGKTGVNSRYGKNLVGAFHQPHAVLADSDCLATLPPRELRAGYAEIVKSGLIGEPALFSWCQDHGAALVSGDAGLQAEAVLRACAFKAAVVGDDEREEKASDGRALLNLGHTFGHALEAEYGFTGALLHGEAVALGTVLAFRLSARLGLCAPADAEQVQEHLESVGLPTELRTLNRRFSAGTLIHHMQRDKKMRDGQLTFILVRGIGQAFTSREVPAESVTELLLSEGCTA